MLAIALVALGWLVDNLYPDIWQEISEKRVATLIGIGVALTVIIVLLAKGSASLGWTGFRGKTLWDLLQLLIVPLVLVGIGLLFEMQQADRQRATEEQQQALEERRAEAEQELAEQRAQDEALQAYLDQMGTLLLERDLRNSQEDSEVRTLARARTLTVLGRLDPARKAQVIQFLVEAELVQSVDDRDPIVALSGVDLSHAELSETDLSGANLSNANLSNADLSEATVAWPPQPADVRGGPLPAAPHPIPSAPWVTEADLSAADLSDADLSEANLRGAALSGASLRGADLSSANLNDADLTAAFLNDADLSGENVVGYLYGADLDLANLRGAKGITNEELLLQAVSLDGAIMPNGQKYEDWLKTKDSEEDVENE
jgi:uncharacterized protein YjbI with pentapeptide repeats